MPLRVGDVADKAYDALAADSTLTALLGGTSKVYSLVPEDTTTPYVHVLGGREAPWAPETNSYVTREVDVDVDVWSAYRGTKEIDDIGSQIVTTLLAVTSWTGLSGFAYVWFVGTERPTQEFIEGLSWYRRRVTCRVYLGGA